MIWNYIKTMGLVSLNMSLHAVFRNLVALIITSGETTGGYQELQVFRKMEHGLRYFTLIGYGFIYQPCFVELRDR